ncbi:efflux RND transporter periplasmic adaptor subunit [Litoribacter ruber]|uniref:Efflux RND transporter periplasmic adaptor subunit n=1 Tax=Litoribacter ruber TaxID=702568 RepID=A0AAP2CKP5_9BACT|nr:MULTISPECIES: efflux RND transporter periplasmic adaptor subunit [Litoribacter]MBS9525026.1 efflux RND transporter periplasmic adaptor subunit [Litoribacter alkaliphilus]MBT0811816.1 efflux RND transporter periplasmic adaptor subunit [Litoribacter ruber]
MAKNLLIVLGCTAVVIMILYKVFSPGKSTEGSDLIVAAKKGKFKVEITTTGELRAQRSVKIMGPQRAREFRLSQLKIEQIVDEGTVVKEGDFIASLDKSDLFGKVSDAQGKLDQVKSQYEQTQLDTALSLRQDRDNLINLTYQVEEQQLVLDQSQYEPPATIKQYEYNLAKAKRDLKQAEENYKIKFNQAVAKMAEVAANLRKEEREFKQMEAMLDEFTIYAPQDGMVIYENGWDGNKVGPGSSISAWNPVVATLPDLTSMLSITYVNEVDIRKVKVGQKVELGMDAFPEKRLSGRVTRVANVGQQRSNSDAKVFEVTILVNESDPVMRPAMTTSNNIIADELTEAVYVPLEAVHVENDSINYVLLNNGVKQEVKLGLSNTNEVVIQKGLNSGDRVYLSTPKWNSDKPVKLLKELDGKREDEVLEHGVTHLGK